jgi:hypothetical protein
MFGNDQNDDNNSGNSGVQPMSTKPVNNVLLGIDDDEQSVPTTGFTEPSGSPVIGQATPPPENTDSPIMPVGSPPGPVIAPSNSTPAPVFDEPKTEEPVVSSTEEPSLSGDNDLLSIKKEALEELSPLIDHLDQDSEEKFKTTMMMIQASDNKELIPQAFNVAKQISDDKKRAQALLDIVNEINYFTHKTED